MKKVPKNIFFPISGGFDNSSQYRYGKGVNNTLTFCLCLFLNLDHGSGQVCLILLLIIISLPVLNDLNSPKAEENGIEVVDGGDPIN